MYRRVPQVRALHTSLWLLQVVDRLSDRPATSQDAFDWRLPSEEMADIAHCRNAAEHREAARQPCSTPPT